MLNFDRSGMIVPPGKIVKRWSEDFESGALPWWLTAGASAADAGSSRAWLDKTTTRGGIQLTTAAAASARSSLFAPPVNLALHSAIRVRAQFTGVFPASGASFILGCYDDIASPLGGAAFRKLATLSAPQFIAYRKTTAGTSSTQNIALPFEGMASSVKTFDLSLLIDCVDKTIYLQENGDQMRTFWTPTISGSVTDPLSMGVATPFIRIVTGDGTARSMIVHRFEVERWMP